MPRLRLQSPLAKTLAAVAAVLVLGALAGVLYVILSGPVHAVDQVPKALAKLAPENKPHTAPAVAFAGPDGKRHLLSEFKGRYVLLNLWATWCAPCVKELPALAQLAAAVPPAKLKVLAVNVGRSDARETGDFLTKHHADRLGVWRDTNIALVRAFTAYGLPTTVLIDPQGREVARAVGAADWNAPAAIAYFKALPMPKKPTPRPAS